VKIFITAATELEIAPLKKLVKENSLKKKINFLVTGIGMTATAYHLVKNNIKKYNLAINIGVAGSFKKEISLGEVVNVTSDCFADLGAEDKNSFLTLAEMGLQKKNKFPFRNERLFNLTSKKYPALKRLKTVNAITVNTVHGNEKSIKSTIKKYNPDIESMEGAAFFYVCMMEKVPCVQLRAISNYVERRNKNNWNIPLAINNLTEVTFDFLRTVLK
jgi:futalosine hydrolase